MLVSWEWRSAAKAGTYKPKHYWRTSSAGTCAMEFDLLVLLSVAIRAKSPAGTLDLHFRLFTLMLTIDNGG